MVNCIVVLVLVLRLKAPRSSRPSLLRAKLRARVVFPLTMIGLENTLWLARPMQSAQVILARLLLAVVAYLVRRVGRLERLGLISMVLVERASAGVARAVGLGIGPLVALLES